MSNQQRNIKRIGLIAGLGLLSAAIVAALPGEGETQAFIVQGKDLAAVEAAVQAVGGDITHELGIINAVGAQLTAAQLKSLHGLEGVRLVYEDHNIRTTSDTGLDGDPGIPGVDPGSALGDIKTTDRRIGSGDAEKGAIDSELVSESRLATGLYFKDVNVPQGALIVDARVTYKSLPTDKIDDVVGPAGILIQGQDADDALIFNRAEQDVTTRTRTAAGVVWTSANSVEDPAPGTADISPVVQEIVDRGGWSSGNALALFFESAGTDTDWSYGYNASQEPKLLIQYAPEKGPRTVNTVSADNATLITGGTVNVLMQLEAERAVSDLDAELEVRTVAGAATASCVSTASVPRDLPAGGSVTASWECTTSGLGEIRFAGIAEGKVDGTRYYFFESLSNLVTATWDAEAMIEDPGCTLSGAPLLGLGSDRIAWEVTNTSDIDLHLDGAMILRPAVNGGLKEFKYDGRKLFEGAYIDGISATFWSGDWDANDSDIDIEAGKSEKVEFKFDRNIVKDHQVYEVRLFFREGCLVDYPPPAGMLVDTDSDDHAKRSYISTLVGADFLHWEGIDGDGIGVAVVDTGIWAKDGKARDFLRRGPWGNERLVAHYDARADQSLNTDANSDENGHGSHVASLLASSRFKDGEFNGIAPNANLIAVRAFDRDGQGSYADVIRGLDWVFTHKDAHNIRVVNLSFSAEPRSFYWDDPLNQAAMALWRAGIVVVASAGNRGPDPLTVGVPGNVPYVITVGAMTDSMTPEDAGDDRLASFSSTGPTVEGFVKPEILAPGGHVRGLMHKDNKLADWHPQFHDGDGYYTMSGTSQSAAVVSGVAALMLQAEPSLTPDELKCRLMATASMAMSEDGAPAYGIFQQGAGLVNAYDAVYSTDTGCANRGLDIAADLADAQHYAGPGRIDADGNLFIEGPDGTLYSGSFLWSDAFVWSDSFVWSDAFVWSDSFLWSDAFIWSDSFLWSDAFIWSDSFVWSDAFVWSDSFLWSDALAEPVDINTWVPQE